MTRTRWILIPSLTFSALVACGGGDSSDTAGPALNPLIKVMNLVSLLILPAIIKLSEPGDSDVPRYLIAGVALVIIIGAVAFSKRKAPAMAAAA